MGSLKPFPDLPNYESCIKFQGRSILPPLISAERRLDIQKIRCQVFMIQEKIHQRKLNQKFEEGSNIIEDCQTDSNVIQTDLINFDSTTPASAAGSTSSLNNICSNEYNNRTVLLPEASRACPEDSEVNEIFSKFSFGDPPPLDELNYSLQASLEDSGSSNKYVTAINDSFHSEPSSADSEISSAQQLSDTDYQSMNTVIINTTDDADTNRDSDSVLTSVARSSDLEKYMVCSNEDDRGGSEQSTIPQESDVCTLINLSPSTSGGDTLIDHSVSSTPLVPASGVPLSPSCLVSGNTGPMACSSPIPEENKQKVDLQYVPGPSQPDNSHASPDNSKHGHKRRNSYTVELPSPVLLQSHANCPCNASPAMVAEPHSCCIAIPAASAINKVTEVQNNKDISEIGQRCENILNQNVTVSIPASPINNEAVEMQNSNDSAVDPINVNSEEPIEEPCEVKRENRTETPIVISDRVDNFSLLNMEGLLAQLYKTFKENHEKKVERLLKDQHEQWARLNKEFHEQEQELLTKFQNINSNWQGETLISNGVLVPFCDSNLDNSSVDVLVDVDDIESFVTDPVASKEIDVSSDSIHPTDCDSPELPPLVISAASTEQRIEELLIRDEDAERERIVADSVMKKKFEKLSAVAKGFLHRRLMQTPLLQTMRNTIIDSTALLNLMYEKSEKEPLEEDDILLYEGLVKQVCKAVADIQHIFLELPPKDRMKIISESRRRKSEKPKQITIVPTTSSKPIVSPAPVNTSSQHRKLSAATLKRMECRKMKSQEGFGTRDIRRSASTQSVRPRKSTSKHTLTPKRPQSSSSRCLNRTSPSARYISSGVVLYE